MVFSSVPIYLDPPNWNQHAPNQAASGGGGGGGGGDALQLQPGMAAPASESGMAAAAIRPGSMAERARLAKVPQPDPALKCPRCDSTNTKFCYFNNYSLSQPRHFCKTCRRYWTRGGALRNVPVGGGCRRNKRSKAGGSSSKSSASTTTVDHRQSGASSSSSISTATGGGGAVPSNMLPPAQLPFMALHSFADYGAPNLGLNFSGFQSVDPVEYQMGSSSSVGLEQWRFEQIQQFPFLGGLEPPPPPPPPPPQMSGLFPFDAEVGTDGFGPQVLPRVSGSGLITQLASVKMEDHPHGLNLPRQFLGLPGNDQYWGGGGGGSTGGSSGGWALDFSGFNSSTSANLL